MKITAEEELMYGVMKALYESGIPVSFKGSMVLKACLVEAGFLDDTRHTVDIDGNWRSEKAPTAEQMVTSFQKAIDESGIGLDVSLYRMYGEGRSAGFEIMNRTSGEVLFTMDVDVNRPEIPGRIYEIEGFRFRGAAPLQMITDKVSAISTEKVFRRIKDIVDLYYISKVFDFDRQGIMQTLNATGRSLGSFSGFLSQTDELEHAYAKFRFSGGVNKPPFEDVYQTVKQYIGDILPKNRNREWER